MNTANSLTHLICNARFPLISNSILQDELILYNISPTSLKSITSEFQRLTNKDVTPASDITSLSGGQKVLLMCLLALYSPTKSIVFIDLWHSLDDSTNYEVQTLLSRFGEEKDIICKDSVDAY